MPRMRSLVSTILVVIVAASGAARAGDDCLGGPNTDAPQGKHWYYRLDHAAHRKCWYLGPRSAVIRHVVPTTRHPASRRATPVEARPASAQVVAPRAPVSREVAAVAAPAAAAEIVPNEVFAPPSADAADVVAPALDNLELATRVPGRIAARSEPAMGERMPEQPVRQALPVTSAPTALRAVLASVALLLAAVGVVLIHAARRVLRRMDEVTTPADMGIRRGTREVPAQAVTDEEGWHSTALVPATYGAVLQPEVNPMSPEAIDTAPDVEQSLRQLLRVREGLAA